MKINLLMDSVRGKDKIQIQKQTICFKCKDKQIDAYVIKKIIKFTNGVLDRKFGSGLFVVFEFGKNVEFIDKLTYVIFECICYHLLDNGFNVGLGIIPKNAIASDGIDFSPLAILNKKDLYSIKKKNYIEKFNYDMNDKHFRTIVCANNEAVSKASSDILKFMKLYEKEYGSSKCIQIANCLSELVGNAVEHTGEECLIDINFSKNYISKAKDDNNNYYGLNITVLNFSSVKFGDKLNEKMHLNLELEDRYRELGKIYKIHQKYFDENYCEDDFFNISSIQDKISGDPKKMKSGGRGLHLLVRSLNSLSPREDSSYLLSGSRILFLNNEFLNTNTEWLGFNIENDFYKRPDIGAIQPAVVSIPGTAYNFTYIMKKEV